MNPIEENILKLIEKGYSSADIFNVMTHAGWESEEVQFSMNSIYEQRAKENEEIARQRKEAIDRVNASYEELKKKSKPVQSDAFLGTFPGERSSALDAVDEIDNEVMTTAARQVAVNNLEGIAKKIISSQQELDGLGEDDASQKRAVALQNQIEQLNEDLRESWNEVSSFGGNLGDFADIGSITKESPGWEKASEGDILVRAMQDVLVRTNMQSRRDADKQKELGIASRNTFSNMLGVEFPEIESVGDLQNELMAGALDRAMARAKEEEAMMEDPYEGFDGEAWQKEMEDIGAWENFFRGVGSTIGQAEAGIGLQLDDLGNALRDNPAAGFLLSTAPIAKLAALTSFGFDLADSAGVDTRAEIIDYLRRQKEKDRIRNFERKKQLVKNPDYWNLGTTEALVKINTDLKEGKIDFNQAAYAWHGVSRNTMAEVAPSAAVYGSLSLTGAPGIFAIGGMASGQKYGDLTLERPDLSMAEKQIIATTVGVAEASLNAIFMGAENLALSGIKSLSTRAAVKETVKNIGKKAAAEQAPIAWRFVKGVGGEALEEFAAYATDFAITNAVDGLAGRPTKEWNKYEAWDAAIGGALGGLGFSSIGLVKSVANRGHHQTRATKLALQQKIIELRQEIANTPIGEVVELGDGTVVSRRYELNKQLSLLNAQYRELSAMEVATYSNFSPRDRARVKKINQEIAFLEDQIKYKKDSAGIRLNKDQIANLEQRLESALKEKESIESRYPSVDQATAEISKSETAQVADVENNESPVESKQVPQKETQEQHQDAKQPEMSDPVRQEGEQLSLFNEKDFATKEEKQEPVQEEAPVEETPVEEAPVEEAPVEEAPVEEAPKQEKDIYSTDNEVDTEKGFDLADRSRVGDDAGQVSIASASAFNKALKGFRKLIQKAGTKIYVASRADFDAIAEARNPERFREIKIAGNRIGGYYDTQNNAIVLPSDARISSIQEEFGHAFMLPIINGQANPALQQELFDLLMNDVETRLSGKALNKFQNWKESRNKKYKDQTTPRYREEMIIGFFKYYKENVGDFKGLGGRIRQILNTILKKAGHQGELPFRTDNQLLKFAENYAQMTEGVEADIEVTQEEFQKAQKRAKARIKKEDLNKREDESEDEYRARLEAMVTELTEMATPEDVAKKEAQDLQQDEEAEPPGIDDLYSIEGRKKFTYLQDTEVFYEDFPYVNVGDVPTGMPRMKKAKFKDYFHFRNWYTHMTANHRRSRIGKMYFIKDGKKYDIKPPKPKVDKNGKPIYVQGAPSEKIKYIDRQWDKRDAQVRKLKEARSVWFDFVGDAYQAMKRAGADGANGAAFVPGFDYDAYSQLETQEEKEAFRGKFTTDLLSKTPEEITELSEIARKNLDALKNSGMSVEEIAEADQASLFNMSGIKPEAERDNGDIQDMFAIEEGSLPEKPYINKNRGLRKYDKGTIRDIINTFMPIMGFDMSTSMVPGLGLKSGVSYLRKNPETTVQVAGKKVAGTLLTTHLDFNTANLVRLKLQNHAIKIWQDSGRTEGKMAVGFSFLNPEAVKGNPDVFRAVMKGVLRSAKESLNEKAGERLHSTPSQVMTNLLLANSSNIRDVVTKRRTVSDEVRMKIFTNDAKSFTYEELKQVIDALIEHQYEFPDSFATRKSYMKKPIVDEFFRYEKYINDRRVPSDKGIRTIDSMLIDHFNDPDFEGVPPGTLAAYHKFDYKLKVEGRKGSERFKLEGIHIKELGKDVGFGFGLVTTNTTDGIKAMRETYELSALNPSYRFKGEMSEGLDSYKDPQERALLANQRSLFELNQSRTDDGLGDKSQDDMMSIEQDLMSQETDQGTFEMPVLSGFQRWRNVWIRRLVDKYNDIFDVQKAIETQKGRLNKSMDFKMKEELMYGKAAQDLLNLDKKIEELKSVMKDEGVALDTLNDYLYALHAKERNRVIKERIEADNEQRAKQKKKLKPVTEKGSGMSNEDADAILNAVKPSQKRGLEKLEKLVRDIQADTKDTMIKFGLESQETIDAWDEMFSQYVPLAGIATDEQSEATSSYPTGGAGLSVFGPMTKRAKGRKTQAENVLAQVIAQNAATHVKARTNEAVRSLYDLAKNNPNPDVWEVLDEANSLDPHVVSVRVDGEQKFIRFKDASHAQTLRNMNLPETNLFLKILRAPSNWLRRSFTTLNPEFVVSNFARDIQTAVFNAAAEAEIEGGILNGEKVMGDIIKTVPKTLKSLLRGQLGREQDAEMKRYYEDFKEDGAKTGWAYAKRLNEIAADLEKSASETTRMQEILGKGKNAIDFVEGMNEAFEDATRLAAYIAARENGVSREKAAQLAKNITVNFNKHGEWGQALNGVYLFFNASVQGTARMFKTVGTLKPVTRPDGSTREWYERVNTAQKMAAGLTLFSAMLAMINAGLSGEDEDDVLFYDKIPDYVKERNLIIMNPRDGKTYYKIPLPYGFNIFSNIGTVAADVSRGGMPVGKGMHFLGQGLINAFSPISFGQSESLGRTLAKGGIPTVAKPFFDAWGFNETYFGGPVAAEQLPFGTKRPESSMSFRSPEAVKSWFTWLNEVTGGSDRVSGGIDMNPDRMWYVFEYFIGGAGNFVNRTGKTIRSVQGKFKDSDYDIAANDIPFVRIMYGEQSRYYDHGKYRDNETKVRQLFLERKDTRDWDNPRYEGIVKLDNKLKASEKKLKVLREQRRKARQIKDWTRRSIEVQRIMDEERRIIMEFNKMYNELRKD